MTTATTTTTPQINDFIGWMRKNNRAARAARFCCNFWRSLPNDDVKFSFLRFWRQREPAAVNIFHSLPLHDNHSWQARESAFHLFYTLWPAWNHRKTLNLTQSSIFMWLFRCSSRRCFLNFQIDPKSVPHERRDYYSTFNQSDHCFLVLSLLLSLIWSLSNNEGKDNARK